MKAKGTLSQNATYCKKDGEWKEWGEATGAKSGKRSDVLALRDGVLEGKNDLELALEDSTCRASAQFQRFSENLRAMQRSKAAREALELSLENKPLRPWQEEAVANLETYDIRTTLVWKPDVNGSSFDWHFDTRSLL